MIIDGQKHSFTNFWDKPRQKKWEKFSAAFHYFFVASAFTRCKYFLTNF